MFYTVYKITNKINGKIYIGCHKTEDVDDNYMGSGKIIRRAIEKYGVENFQKHILATFDSEDQMFDEEKNLISTLNPDYNLHEGGNGGWDYINVSGLNNHTKDYKKVSDKLKGRKPHKNCLEGVRIGHKEGKYKHTYKYIENFEHTQDTKRKIGEANSKHQKGEKNSQYGTMWITNGSENKRIKKDVDIIPEGWYKGRVTRKAKR